MIYSASRRTDLVAFHPDIIADKVRASRKLEAIVVWTKDPRNLVNHQGLQLVVRRVPMVLQLTITGLAGSDWEPMVPKWTTFLKELKQLGTLLPPGAIRWRFDPVIPTPGIQERFQRIKADLEDVLGRLEEVIISFPDAYKHVVNRVQKAGIPWPRLDLERKRELIAMMLEEFTKGSEIDFRPIKLCSEPVLLNEPGTARCSCVDGLLFDKLYGIPLGELPKDPGQRKQCGCVKSVDIGSYELACGHRCRYCYANPADGGEDSNAIPEATQKEEGEE